MHCYFCERLRQRFLLVIHFRNRGQFVYCPCSMVFADRLTSASGLLAIRLLPAITIVSLFEDCGLSMGKVLHVCPICHDGSLADRVFLAQASICSGVFHGSPPADIPPLNRPKIVWVATIDVFPRKNSGGFLDKSLSFLCRIYSNAVIRRSHFK